MPQAKGIVDDVTRVVGRLKDTSRQGGGKFTLACIPTMTSRRLPESMRRYALIHQANRIRIADANGFEVRHRSTAVGLVAAGVGVAILPAATLEEGADHGLCRLPLVRPVIKRKFCVITERNSTLSPAASAFFDLLMTQARVVGQS